MGAFEHVIVLLSFVYALAITHLLLCTAGLIRASTRVRFSWLHAFWMLNALVVIFANWVSFWDLHALPTWSMASVGFTLVMGIANYLQAALTCPEVAPTGEIDLRAFHAQQRGRYLGAAAISFALAFVANIVFGLQFGVVQYTAQNFAVLPMMIAVAAAAIFGARWIQIAAPVIVTAMWTFYFSTLQGALHG